MFDSVGGTPVKPESLIKGGKVTMPPTPERKFLQSEIIETGPGLYIAGDGGWIFNGWFLDETLYDFGETVTADITLTAKWILPSLISNGSDGVNSDPTDGDYFVKALTYVIGHPQTYILAIDQNYTLTAAVTLSATSAARLTVIGIGEQKIISDTPTGNLTDINNGGTLTIGENITVAGKEAATDPLFVISNGILAMAKGSKITGHKTSGLYGVIHLSSATSRFLMNEGEISGCATTATSGSYAGIVAIQNGLFTMNGGTIKENTSARWGAVVVYVTDGFIMNGGSITENINTRADGGAGGVSFSRSTGSGSFNGGSITKNTGKMGDIGFNSHNTSLASNSCITLSGDMEIQSLTVRRGSAGNAVQLFINKWTGSVEKLNLYYDNASLAAVRTDWVNAQVYKNTAADIVAEELKGFLQVNFMNNTFDTRDAWLDGYKLMQQDTTSAGRKTAVLK
jgi:hypothetical protein